MPVDSRNQTEEREIELSIVMPCLNEAETLGICSGKARAALDEHGIAGEIVVADNLFASGAANRGYPDGFSRCSRSASSRMNRADWNDCASS